MQIAVLGIGAIGAGMARSLLREGHAVTAWNRTPLLDRLYARPSTAGAGPLDIARLSTAGAGPLDMARLAVSLGDPAWVGRPAPGAAARVMLDRLVRTVLRRCRRTSSRAGPRRG